MADPQPTPRLGRRRLRRLALAGGLTLGLLVGGAALGVAGGSSHAPVLAAASTEQVVPYRDPAGRFEFSHPAGWRPESVDGGVLLHVGGQDAVSVKRTELAEPVDSTNLADLRAVTDAVLGAPEAGLKVLQASPTTLGGLPGVQYLYTFDSSGLRGAHTHWFAFDGRTMYTLVFQTLPDTGFAALAPAFDRVAESFRVVES
ncbi:MAG: hypothetical protein ACT4QG_05820 [Sporichthyaceae bacterium]